MNESTASEYALRLSNFMNFVADEYPDILDMDNLLIMLKQGNLDPYNLLNGYAAYLRNRNVSALTMKQRVVTIKNFFEYCDIDIKSTEIQVKSKATKSNKKKERIVIKRRYYRNIQRMRQHSHENICNVTSSHRNVRR
jgi:integrase